MASKTAERQFGAEGKAYVSSRDFEAGLGRMSAPRSRRGERMARLLVWGTLGLFFILNITNLLLANQNRNLNGELETTLETQYNPSYRVRFADLGEAVVTGWYTGGPAPLDLGTGVSWRGQDASSAGAAAIAAAPTAAPTAPDTPELAVSDVSFLYGDQVQTPGSETFYQERLVYYALVNGLPYNIAVTIGIADLDDYSSPPVLLSPPTITPAAAVESSELASAPEGYNELDLSDEAVEQISAWASAWSTGDSAALRQLTKDDRSGYTYLGLNGGWRYVEDSTTVLWSFVDPARDAAVVEIEFTVKVPDTVVPGADGQPATTITGATQTQRMDLLVTDYDSGLPAIVAWGPVGSYVDLQPLANAVETDTITTPPAAPTTDAEGN